MKKQLPFTSASLFSDARRTFAQTMWQRLLATPTIVLSLMSLFTMAFAAGILFHQTSQPGTTWLEDGPQIFWTVMLMIGTYIAGISASWSGK